MKLLYLIRHAKSSWSNPHLSDPERPLNKRGKRDAPFMGKRLSSAAVSFDLMLSSTAKRARKTARLIAREVGYKKEDIVYSSNIYTYNLNDLVGLVRGVDDGVNRCALVGHNHVITECAEWLTGRVIVNIPTSGIVAIEFDVAHWNEVGQEKGNMLFFDYPKLHGDRSRGE